MKKYLAIIVTVGALALAAFICIHFYEYVFAKNIDGQIVRVERVNQNETIISGNRGVPASQMFSFGIAIRDKQGEIHTASSEDRQWAVVQSGQCAEAKYFPYAPWDLDKAGTYHNARLLRLYDCPKGAAATGEAAPVALPVTTPQPVST